MKRLKAMLRHPLTAVTMITLLAVVLQHVVSQSAGLDFLKRLEWLTFDWRVKQAANHEVKGEVPLAVVAYGDESMSFVKENLHYDWPWPRSIHAQLLEGLARQGPAAVCFEILFGDRFPGTQQGQSSSSDEQFALQIRQSGNVVLAAIAELSAGSSRQPGKVTYPSTLFRTNAWAVGQIHVPQDVDGVVRQIEPFVLDEQHRRVWHLGIEAAARLLHLDLDNPDIRSDRIVLLGTNGIRRVLPLDRQGRVFIHWAIGWDSPHLPKLAFEQVSGLKSNTPSGLDIKNRIVWIGIGDAERFRDVRSTPLGQTPAQTVGLNVAFDLINDRFVRRSGGLLDALLVIGLCLSAALLALKTRPWLASGATLTLMILYVVATQWAFRHFQWWLPMVVPLAATFLVTHVGVVLKRPDPMSLAKRFFGRAGFVRVQSRSPHLLQLHPGLGQSAGYVVHWRPGGDLVPHTLAEILSKKRGKESGRSSKVYLIYSGRGPASQTIQKGRQRLGCDIIPIFSTMLERASGSLDYRDRLKELEEPYLVRTDPYADFKPILDPIWFYGREDLEEQLPQLLAQGQHVGVFGLRKVGKTSLANQLRQRFVATPCIFLDCQGIAPKAVSYFEAVYRGLHADLRALRIRRLPAPTPIQNGEDFQRAILALFECWNRSGQSEPFIVVLDEIDKFFPSAEVADAEVIQAEYVTFTRILRSLAQTRQCLVLLVIAYRPNVSRQNLLSPRVGENPMFNSFQEVFLNFLSPAASQRMVQEIGLWKGIQWEEEAAAQVFDYCGGHPLIIRYFSSHASRKGKTQQIDLRRIQETAQELKRALRKNEIGNYYKEGVWELLLEPEREVLTLVARQGSQGLAESDLPSTRDEALNNLENFGLVENRAGCLHLKGALFAAWMDRQLGAGP